MRLSEHDKSRSRFHLGYAGTTGINEQDVTQIEQAMDQIRDSYIFGQVVNLLDRCDRAYLKTDMTTEPATEKQLYVGDLNRAKIDFSLATAARQWNEVYLMEVDKLAQVLVVNNMKRPDIAERRQDRASGVYIYPVPGPADTCIISIIDSTSLLCGGSGF